MEKVTKKYSPVMNFLRTPTPTLIGIYIVMLIFFSLGSENFLAIQNMKGIFNNFAVFGIMAAGVAVVMVGGGFDLSVGSVAGLAGIVSAVLLMKGIELSTPYVFVIAMVIGCLVGLINGLIIVKVGINPIITTLGTLAIFRGICYFWADLNPRIYNIFVQNFGRKYIGGVFPVTTVYIIVAFTIITLIFKFTRFGRNLFTIGGNENLARLAGIPVDRTKIISYMISGFFAAIAGLLLISQLGSGRPEYGTGAELEIITIVVLGGVIVGGGKGNFLGVFIALVIIQTISNGLVLIDLPVYLRMVVKGALLVLVIAIDAIRSKRHLLRY
jgi:ribose transport system permease protein